MAGHIAHSAPTWTGATERVRSEYEAVEDELLALADTLLAGEQILDRAAAEHLVRVLGAVSALYAAHRVDDDGNCSICRPSRRTWLHASPPQGGCTVHAALTRHLGLTTAASDKT